MWHEFKWCDEIQILHIEIYQVVWCNSEQNMPESNISLMKQIHNDMKWRNNTSEGIENVRSTIRKITL